MLWTILVILLILWLLGFIGHIGGGLIHILLVVAVIVLIYNLVTGRRAQVVGHGRVDPTPLLKHTFSLNEIKEACELSASAREA